MINIGIEIETFAIKIMTGLVLEIDTNNMPIKIALIK